MAFGHAHNAFVEKVNAEMKESDAFGV